MNEDSMNIQTISIDHESFQQDQKSKEIVNKIKKTPMNPTPLYVSFLSISIIIQILY
jgi:hypothetical protein